MLKYVRLIVMRLSQLPMDSSGGSPKHIRKVVKLGLKQPNSIQQPVFRSLLLLTLLLTLCGASFSAMAAEAATKHEVVFLLDISGSMNDNDPEQLAPDCLKELLCALPSNYAVGMVTFNGDVQMTKPLDTQHDQVNAALEQVQYSGYTNTGAGLAKALTLLSDSPADKTIVLLTDGEIGLDSPVATQASQAEFNRAMQTAQQRGVRLCTVAIDWPDDHRPDINICDAAKRQGTLYSVHHTAELSGVVKQILYEQLGVAHIAVNSGNLQTNTLHVQWPQSCNDAAGAKILLTAAAPLGHVSAQYAARSGGVITGKRFALLNLQHPQSDTAQIQLETPNGGQIQTDLIIELDATMQVDVKTLPPDPTGHRLAEVRLTPVSTANPQQLLLNDPYFAGKPIHITADGQPVSATIDNGAIHFTLPADTARTVAINVHYADLGVNIVAPATTAVTIADIGPPASRAIPVKAAVIIAAVFLAAVAVALLIWRWTKQRPEPAPTPVTPPASLYEYAGKLKIFITQAPDDSDIAPLEYNLYRCFTQAEISLATILANCKLPVTLPGAHAIFFSPGVDKALLLTNRSDCTILKNRELLAKNHHCLVHFQEKIHITFEDERSQMIVEYKNVKPSERR